MTLTVPDFSGANVVVVGDVMLDRYWFGPAERVSPEAPVPVVHVDRQEQRPGGAANVAVNLARLGVNATLAGVVGDDDAGRELCSQLQALGIQCDLALSQDIPTITKLRVLSRGQQLIRLDHEQPAATSQASLLEHLTRQLDNADVVILSDYAKGALGNAEELIALCRAAKVPVIVDPKGKDFARYRGATLITPNQAEFEAVAGVCDSDEKLLHEAQQMIDALELDGLLITRSARGMLLVTRKHEPLFLSTQAREVYDVTGAGDTVIAAFCAAIAAGVGMSAAAELSNLAAGLVVRKIGVASVSPAELRVALHSVGKGGRGMISEDALIDIVENARLQGERLVMTNGCFDILHAGHVAYLEEAKTLGDRLIIAVNDDASVRRLKGEGRPVNTVDDRMAVLAGLAAVDWVVQFSEDTPQRLIERVLPDILVKGGDYKADQIVGGAAVLKNGGEVRTLAFREGRSSSGIIAAIRAD